MVAQLDIRDGLIQPPRHHTRDPVQHNGEAPSLSQTQSHTVGFRPLSLLLVVQLRLFSIAYTNDNQIW